MMTKREEKKSMAAVSPGPIVALLPEAAIAWEFHARPHIPPYAIARILDLHSVVYACSNYTA